MTVPQVSRRMVAAGAIALGLPSVVARQSIFPPDRLEDDNAFEKWLHQNVRTGHRLTVPSDPLPLSITRPITVPVGVDIVFLRDLDGTPNGKLIFEGECIVQFDECSNKNVALQFVGGRVSVRGLNYSGDFHEAAIFIEGRGVFDSVIIEDISVKNANFGILRQGEHSQMNGAEIRRARFHNLMGDAIEWNICPNDTKMIFEDIDIDTINDPKGRGNWGIGLGFAGLTFDPEWDRSNYIKQFVVRRITGRRVRQLIHIEAGSDFLISDIKGNDISEEFSRKSNMPSGVICCYGCDNLKIKNVESDGDILIMAGVIAEQYVVPSKNFLLENVVIESGKIVTEMGGSESYAKFIKVKVTNGSIQLFGAVKSLVMDDVVVGGLNMVPRLIEKADFLSGPLKKFMPIKRNKIVKRVILYP